jgi:hypothetical protein
MSLLPVIKQINLMAQSHPIGQLQELRKAQKGLKVVAAGGKIFSHQSTFEHYAYHSGGRTELQFNIGLRPQFRYGVAFSLETGRTLPSITPLIPKLARFNEYLTSNPEDFDDLQMRYWDGDNPMPVGPPAPILAKFVKNGVFIFLGRFLRSQKQIDYEQILCDFDRLLPLYEFVEGDQTDPPNPSVQKHFEFKAGCKAKPSSTTATITERLLNVDLRHNDIQKALNEHLVATYGVDNVGAERSSGTGKVDLIVRQANVFWFYEIKPSLPARACIRQALSQLLEYSFWPNAQEAQRLIVVGERAIDAESREYLQRLQKQFRLPVYYQQFDLANKTFV